MTDFYFSCRFCWAKVEADIADPKILDLLQCPQCKRKIS